MQSEIDPEDPSAANNASYAAFNPPPDLVSNDVGLYPDRDPFWGQPGRPDCLPLHGTACSSVSILFFVTPNSTEDPR